MVGYVYYCSVYPCNDAFRILISHTSKAFLVYLWYANCFFFVFVTYDHSGPRQDYGSYDYLARIVWHGGMLCRITGLLLVVLLFLLFHEDWLGDSGAGAHMFLLVALIAAACANVSASFRET